MTACSSECVLEFFRSVRFWFLNERSREIFSCNFIKPASKASGRGGQPEM